MSSSNGKAKPRRSRRARTRWPVLLIDPPWKMQNYGMAKHGAQRAHYSGMTTPELCALPVGELAEENALCFLWSTGPKDAEAAHVELLRAWGFRPTTCAFSWVKCYPTCIGCGHHWDDHVPDPAGHDVPGRCVHRGKLPRGAPRTGVAELDQVACFCPGFSPKAYFGTGCYTGGGTERVWLGVKGGGFSKARKHKDIRHTLIAPLPCHPGTRRKIHSAKPTAIHDRIERLAAGPYLELFARRAHPGWSVWGKQAPDAIACVLDDAAE